MNTGEAKAEKEEKLKEYYVAKFWNTENNLLIKLPKEFTEHSEFPLRKELLLLAIPKKDCIIIKNVTP